MFYFLKAFSLNFIECSIQFIEKLCSLLGSFKIAIALSKGKKKCSLLPEIKK